MGSLWSPKLVLDHGKCKRPVAGSSCFHRPRQWFNVQESSNSNPPASSHRIYTSVLPTYDHLYMSCAVSPHLGRCSMLLRIAGGGRQKSLARTCKGGEVFLAFVGVGKMCHPEIFGRGFHRISKIRIQIPMMLHFRSSEKIINLHPNKGLLQAVCYGPLCYGPPSQPLESWQFSCGFLQGCPTLGSLRWLRWLRSGGNFSTSSQRTESLVFVGAHHATELAVNS